MALATVQRLAAGWGGLVFRYYAWALRRDRVHILGRRPEGPAIWVSWHEANLLAIVSYPRLDLARRCHSLVPHGLRGWVASDWLRKVSMVPATLPPAGRFDAPPALAALEAALLAGDDAVVAADGGGTARRIRRGPFWLAARTGCPLIPVGAAVRRAVRLPRWDRLLIPLPGATVSFAFGEPFLVGTDERADAALRGRLAEALDTQTERAKLALAQVRSVQVST